MSHTKEETSTDEPKGGDLRVPMDIWDIRACRDQGKGVREDLQLIREGILRWWKRNFIR